MFMKRVRFICANLRRQELGSEMGFLAPTDFPVMAVVQKNDFVMNFCIFEFT